MCLIVVAVLMSLLLPRLAELRQASRPGRLQAAAAAARVAASLFHARCEAVQAASPPGDCTQLALDGAVIAGVHGWPAASSDGIARAATLAAASGPARLDAFTLRTGERNGTPALYIGLGNQSCEFVYVQAKRLGDVPEVDIVDASCH
ncbi:hypothetical protein [Ideonella sp. BN130291]|uniref:hypothetical protein n=1 Tax=Ideonella sp. BN130291 TaxID=3112940 RepID=UPI002E2553F2|nr:hypothetical protein [Ideonella sp. BN130291]